MKKTPAPFRFKHFLLHQAHDVMKVSTDSILLGSWVNPVGAKNILDIGTGTGILALLMAQKSTAEIDAIDISESACSLARKNFLESPWSNRLKVYETSVQNFRPEKKYDLIISNPPYFQNSLKSPYASRNSFRHDSGMRYNDLLTGISNSLLPDGEVFVAVPSLHTDSFVDLLTLSGLYCTDKLLVTSIAGNKPYLALLKICRTMLSIPKVHKLDIYLEGGKYSPEFIAITKESYLPDFIR